MGFGYFTEPYSSATAIIPSDTGRFASPSRAIYTGAGGDITVLFADDGAPVLLKSTAAGQVLPIRVVAVRATGTAATGIVVLR